MQGIKKIPKQTNKKNPQKYLEIGDLCYYEKIIYRRVLKRKVLFKCIRGIKLDLN